MKKSFLIFLFILLSNTILFGSHIIGGDFQIQMINQTNGGGNYHIKLRIYRDDVNAASGATIPTSLTIGVYQIGTNMQVASQSLTLTSSSFVPLGDPCYTPDPNVVRIEEGILESPSNLFIPDYGPGYYVQAQINARNSLAINFQSGGTMTWFAMIPDPSIGLNSTPDFGDYPSDAYFCISGPKQFSYPITDIDGDSLVYSLVQPLDAWNPSNGTSAGSGAYPYYPGLNWQSGYSLNNIVGGTPPMSINQTTGVITAAPSTIGFFTFAIRVEEFRNGVKIGEVRRDVQYVSLNCTSGSPPTFLNTVPVMNQTIQIPYNKKYCKDLIFNDINTTDTLYIEMTSPLFNNGAYQTTPTPDANGDLHYYYNWNGTAWNNSVVIPPNQFDPVVNAEWNIGTIANRFCWTPKCDDINGIFPFQVNAFSLGCDGKYQDSIKFNIEVVPPTPNLQTPGDQFITYGTEYCRDISFKDTSIVDLLSISINSEIFSQGAYYPTIGNDWLYNDSILTNVPNGANNTEAVGTRFCWTPDCEHIGNTYNVQAILSSVDCPNTIGDTINFNLTVNPPFDSLGIVPNVITPNGDGLNDKYKISGISNPCTDEIKVQIFNRWGTLVYEESEVVEFEWDGTSKGGGEVPAGTYFVLVHGIFGNETVELKQRSVTVLR